MVDSKNDAFAMSPMDKGMQMFGESVREYSGNLFRDWLMIGPDLFAHFVVRGGRPAEERPKPKKARSTSKSDSG